MLCQYRTWRRKGYASTGLTRRADQSMRNTKSSAALMLHARHTPRQYRTNHVLPRLALAPYAMGVPHNALMLHTLAQYCTVISSSVYEYSVSAYEGGVSAY
eukprot:3641196-Rhodomonas_salina.2